MFYVVSFIASQGAKCKMSNKFGIFLKMNLTKITKKINSYHANFSHFIFFLNLNNEKLKTYFRNKIIVDRVMLNLIQL